ncbi:MAG: c-type cytochrome [Actinomycetota bacterium]|nr:c-type cytochrome [Actinomycetota bacterium]
MTHVEDSIDDHSPTGKGLFVEEDFDVDDAVELGFEPAVSATGAEPAAVKAARSRKPAATSKRSSRRGLRRRLGAGAVLIAALITMGGTYAAFATAGAPAASDAADIAAGRQLYQTSCITCHGANLQGVRDRAPALLGVGAASVYFQVSTGRMPASGQGADQKRKTAKFDEQQTKQLAAYVQSIGGGPELPFGKLRDGDIASGGELFRLNCASCHSTVGSGGAALSAGKVAPSLNDATDAQMYTAMLSGPESMPIFSDNQLTPAQKREVINYVQTLKASKDPGGNGIARIGPVSEALVFFVAGVGAVMAAIMWIGAKAE